MAKLRAENAELQLNLSAARVDASRAQPVPAAPASRDPELLRLRAEVAELRRQKGQWTRGAPTSRIEAPATSAEPAEVPFEIRRRNNTQVLKSLVLALHFAIDDRESGKAGGKLDIVNANGEPTPQLRREIEKILERDKELADIKLDTAWRDLEFLITDGADLGKLDPTTIVARTVAMQTPDGKWMRVYAIADGSAHLRVHQTPDEVWQAPSQ